MYVTSYKLQITEKPFAFNGRQILPGKCLSNPVGQQMRIAVELHYPQVVKTY